MSIIIETIKRNQKIQEEKNKKEQERLKQLILNNNELIKLLKQSDLDSIEIEKQLSELTINLDLQETILIDLFSFFKKSSDRFLHIQEKMKSEKDLKKEEEKKLKDLKNKQKNKHQKLKLKDQNIDDDIKNIKTMVNYLLNHLEKTVSK